METPQSFSFGIMMGLVIAACIGVGSTFSLKPGKQNYYLILLMLFLVHNYFCATKVIKQNK